VAPTAEAVAGAADVEMIKEKKEEGEAAAPAKGEKAAAKPGEKAPAEKAGEKKPEKAEKAPEKKK
jgi:hypothetical protein